MALLGNCSRQFERATALDPWEEVLNRGWFTCRQKLKLLPIVAPPELKTKFIRPETPVLREVLGAGYVFAWGGGADGCLGHGETDVQVLPKCVDMLRGKHVRGRGLRVAAFDM